LRAPLATALVVVALAATTASADAPSYFSARPELVACTEDTCACRFGERVLVVPNVPSGEACTIAPTKLALIAADRAPQWEASLAFALGSFSDGAASDFAVGVAAAAGVRFDRFAIVGAYRTQTLQAATRPNVTGTLARTSDPMATDVGAVQRFGVEARYSVFKAFSPCKHDRPCALRSDFWIAAGVGEQLIRSTADGQLARPDVDVGLGWSLGGRGLRHHGAYFLEVHSTFARSPAATIDQSLVVATGFAFGN
jgi:hypothetical protein